MKKKIALITGVTGQDGSYLAEFLLNKDYIVHGIKRRSSSLNTERIDHIYQDVNKKNKNFILHYGDMTDSLSLQRIIKELKPDEIYNLAAQSHVAVSFEEPEYTANADALGSLRILEIIKNLKLIKQNFIKQVPLNFMEKLEIPQSEKPHFIQEVLMQSLNYMLIGLLLQRSIQYFCK